MQFMHVLSAQQVPDETANGINDDVVFDQAPPDLDAVENEAIPPQLSSNELGDFLSVDEELFHFNPFPPTQELSNNGVFVTPPDQLDVSMAAQDPLVGDDSIIIQPDDNVIAEFLIEQDMDEFDPCSEIFDKVCYSLDT